MGDITTIGWTDRTFNPWIGCARVSRGCRFCYAETLTTRWAPGTDQWRRNGSRRITTDSNWRKPLKWNRDAQTAGQPLKTFCASLADVFEDHPALPEPRARLFALIEATPWLTWQLLTKRPENIARMVPWTGAWPVNVWVGASVEDQRAADIRLPILSALDGPRVRFVSAEPLVGPVTIAPELMPDWLIIGGESGPLGKVARMSPDWATDLLGTVRPAGVPVFFKQVGSRLAHERGMTGKGEAYNELPPLLRVREFPELVVA
jgi:protein gp37